MAWLKIWDRKNDDDFVYVWVGRWIGRSKCRTREKTEWEQTVSESASRAITKWWWWIIFLSFFFGILFPIYQWGTFLLLLLLIAAIIIIIIIIIYIVSFSMKFALSFDVFLWKECFQQWYILSWLASTQYLLVHISYAITWRNSNKKKRTFCVFGLCLLLLLLLCCRSLFALYCFCFVLFYLRITIQTLHNI